MIDCVLAVQTTSLSNGGGLCLSPFRAKGTNTAEDFLAYVIGMIASGFLTAGDILICDNASIHKATEIIDRLDAAITAANVRLIFLPSYSPELNPAELVFAKVKHELRYRRGGGAFKSEIQRAFDTITLKDLINFYIESIDVPLR
jgi:transposase